MFINFIDIIKFIFNTPFTFSRSLDNISNEWKVFQQKLRCFC